MIEIVLDSNDGNEFLNEERPVYTINTTEANSWEEYRQIAKDFFIRYSNNRIVIIRNICAKFSSNWFAVALFVESCLQETKLEAIVFKVADKTQALATYNPFVALTIALKFVINLSKEDGSSIYKEIGNMGYLGLNIKQNYTNNQIIINLDRGDNCLTLTSSNLTEALVAAGILKTLALCHNNNSVSAIINITKEENKTDPESLVAKIVADIKPWL
ncbi:MAG: hypothetical protein E7019_01315 [Alphaproteobacteria bacterium]|nr:hypothetical protein [Alphaproteobacteria bacterium]